MSVKEVITMNYQFKINDFEGPLDLLLHLIKENKMDITTINTSVIIDEYLKFIHEMKDLNIDVASEYLVMASELVHLKSKIILNIPLEDEEEFEINTEEDLKKKLIEYQKYKDISNDFRVLEFKRSEVYTKLPENILEYKEKDLDMKNILNIDDLLNAFQKFLERHEYQKPLNTKITRKEYSVEERIANIRVILKAKKQISFLSYLIIETKTISLLLSFLF